MNPRVSALLRPPSRRCDREPSAVLIVDMMNLKSGSKPGITQIVTSRGGETDTPFISLWRGRDEETSF